MKKEEKKGVTIYLAGLVQISLRRKTHSSSKLELERRPLEEGGAVVIAASYKAVGTLLPYVNAVDYFRVGSEVSDGGAAVPEEDGSKPKWRADKTTIKLVTLSTLWQITHFKYLINDFNVVRPTLKLLQINVIILLVG